MSAKKASARVRQARSAASKDLGLPLDHWAVKRTTLLSIARDNIEQAVVDGHRVDIGDLLKVETALNEVKAAIPPKPLAVKIGFVETAIGMFTCQHCGQKNEIEGYEAPPKADTKTIENSAPVKPVEAAKAVQTAPPPAPPPPKPVVNPSMEIWDRLSGYAPHAAPDGGGGRIGGPGRAPEFRESHWPDPHRNLDGSPRVLAHPLPMPTNGKGGQ